MSVISSKRIYKNFGECIFLDNGIITLGVTLEEGPRIIYFLSLIHILSLNISSLGQSISISFSELHPTKARVPRYFKFSGKFIFLRLRHVEKANLSINSIESGKIISVNGAFEKAPVSIAVTGHPFISFSIIKGSARCV